MSGEDACRYVSSMSNHVVNPVITPSAASGTPSGILAAALVGPDYKYSAVWTPINLQLGEPSTTHRSSCAGSVIICCHARGIGFLAILLVTAGDELAEGIASNLLMT